MKHLKWHIDDPVTSLETCSGFHEKYWTEDLPDRWKGSFLVIDSEVNSLWNRQLRYLMTTSCDSFIMDAREELKNTITLGRIWESMAGAGVRRDTPVITVGGGLTCDIGALAASTYLRGLRLALIPTTLLCMVDACLGGKTGVNLAGIKNQIGTFLPAEGIVIVPAFLDTLPGREFRSGMAEVLKTALIGDPQIRDLFPGMMEREGSSAETMEIIERCLQVKAEIVVKDLQESGIRMLLNLGHTIGHALESVGSFRLSHGEAVGLGLIVEAAIAAGFGGNEDLPLEIGEILRSIGLPSRLDDVPDMDSLTGFLAMDKKTREDGRKWALPFDWGDCRIVSLTRIEEEAVLPEALSLLKA